MNAPVKSVQAPTDRFPVRDPQHVGVDQPIGTLAIRIGQTSFCTRHRRGLRIRVAHLRAKSPPMVRLHNTKKAHLMPAVVRYVASVVGLLCTPQDLLAERTGLPVAEVDGLVAVLRCGAYDASASPQALPGHPGCLAVIV